MNFKISLALGLAAARPPMGFTMHEVPCEKSKEGHILQFADDMQEAGLVGLGWNTLVLNECWMNASRNANDNIQVDPAQLPNGLSSLSSKLEAKGIRLGATLSSGRTTCHHEKPGSQNYEADDVNFLAKKGIKFLLYEDCLSDQDITSKRYSAVRKAIEETKQDIFLALQPRNQRDWASKFANLFAHSWSYGTLPEAKFSWVDFNFHQNWKVMSQSKQSSLVDFDAL